MSSVVVGPARLDGRRAQLRGGPPGGVGRQRARHLARRAGRREDRPTTRSAATSRSPTCPRTCTWPASSPATPSSRRRSCRGAGRRGGGPRAGLGDADSRAARRGAREPRPPGGVAAQVAVPPPVMSDRGGKCFACLCEDVTAKDIHLSVEEGYDSIELSKRYTTTTMGPCQGRMCQLPAVRLMAKETGTSMADVGTTTARPPWHAVPMGALAGRPVRAGEALVDPRAPPRARRQRDVGGRLAPRLRLRRPEGRGHGRAQGGRADRRVHARQADRARPGRRRVPRPPLPEPLLEPQARPHPLRRDRERHRPRHGRRHHLPARRRQLLRDHHLERRRRDLRLVHLVARRLAPRRAPHGRDAGPLRGEPRGPARAGDHGQAHRARLLGRGLHLPRRQAGRGGGRAVA